MSVGDIAKQTVWPANHCCDRSIDCANCGKHQTTYDRDIVHDCHSRSRASRSLFGPSDHNENKRMAREEEDNQKFCDNNKWNFDFYSEKPMKGRYQWKKLNKTNDFGETGVEKQCWRTKSVANYSKTCPKESMSLSK